MLTRIRRSTFLFRSLIIGIVQFIMLQKILSLNDYISTKGTIYSSDEVQFVEFLYIGIVILLIVSIAQVAMRLHDINKSGWLSLLILIPIVNVFGLALYFIEGDTRDNKYGKNPKTKLPESNENIGMKEEFKFDNSIASLNKKINLLEDSFKLSLISEDEFNKKKKNIEFEIEVINKSKKAEGQKMLFKKSIKPHLEKLNELKNEGLLDELEYNLKVKSLYNKNENIDFRKNNGNLEDNFSIDVQIALLVITIIIIVIIIIISLGIFD